MNATSTIRTEGSVTLDVHLKAEDNHSQPVPGGVRLYYPDLGIDRIIRTDQPAVPGAKVQMAQPLLPEEVATIIGRTAPGGGAFHAARTIARQGRQSGLTQRPALINSGQAFSLLEQECDREGIELISLGGYEPTANFILPLGSDRLVLKNPIRPCLSNSSFQQAEVIRRATWQHRVVSVSPKDPQVARLAAESARTFYFRPTTAFSPEQTLDLARRATGMACNLAEVNDLLRQAGRVVRTRITEDSPLSADYAVDALGRLHHDGWIACDIAACTLGANGSVLVDFASRRAHWLKVRFNTLRVATPVGAGAAWLGYWTFFRETWAAGNAVLADPEVAAALRASHSVARLAGLGPNAYAIDVLPLAASWAGSATNRVFAAASVSGACSPQKLWRRGGVAGRSVACRRIVVAKRNRKSA